MSDIKSMKLKLNNQVIEMIIYFMITTVLLTVFIVVSFQTFNFMNKYSKTSFDPLFNKHRKPNSDEFDYTSLSDINKKGYSLKNIEKSIYEKKNQYDKHLVETDELNKKFDIDIQSTENEVSKESIVDKGSDYKYEKKESTNFFSVLFDKIYDTLF